MQKKKLYNISAKNIQISKWKLKYEELKIVWRISSQKNVVWIIFSISSCDGVVLDYTLLWARLERNLNGILLHSFY